MSIATHDDKKLRWIYCTFDNNSYCCVAFFLHLVSCNIDRQ